MSKKEATKPTVETQVTVENIDQVLESGNKISDNLPAEIEAEIEKERNEKIKSEVRRRIQRARYHRMLTLLQHKLTRRKSDISKAKLAVSGRLERLLMGFTVTEEVIQYAKNCEDTLYKIEAVDVKAKTITITYKGSTSTYKLGEKVPPVIDYIDYDNMWPKVKDEINKLAKTAETEYSESISKLEAYFGAYYDYSWRW